MEGVRKSRNYVQNAMVQARKYSGPHKDSYKEEMLEAIEEQSLDDFYEESDDKE
jgi:hypothetical protein